MIKRILLKIPLGWCLLIPVIIGVYVLPLLQKGMHGDGQHYATISSNWAAGVGDMWHLYFLGLQKFEGHHPPLFFILEGSLFWLFGDHFWVEGLFMLLVLIGHIWLFFALLKSLSRLTMVAEIWHIRHFVVLLYLLSGAMPNWYANNFLDCLLSWFTLFATYCSLRAVMEYDNKKWLWYILMAAAVFLGYLTKGPVGLFPLVFPLLWAALLGMSIFAGLGYSSVVFLLAALAMVIVFLNSPAAWEFMKTYHRLQLFPALKGSIDPNFPQPSTRFANAPSYWERILVTSKILFTQILLPLVLYVAAVLVNYWHTRKLRFVFTTTRVYRKTIVFFLLAACAASCPIMLSPSIYPHYFMPSHPMFVLLFSLLCWSLMPDLRISGNPPILYKLTKPNLWRALSLGATVILLIICVNRYGKATRHPELIELAEQLTKVVPKYSQIYYEEDQMYKLSPFYADKTLWRYDATFRRYSGSVLVKLSEVKYATPKYLLLHSSRIEKYADALKAYTLLATYASGFQLYAYTGAN